MASERTSEKFSPPTTTLRGICSWWEGVKADRTGRAGAARSPVPGLGAALGPATRPANGPTSCESSAPPRTRTTRRPVDGGKPVISQPRYPSQSP
eukprot:6189095-Pleurochrysis_carterae.AAC.2